jgi:hypothetical protein
MYGTAAHGGFYPGHIDPTGTGTVPGFHADFVVNIDPACFTGIWQATNQNPAVSGSGCGNASLYSATVDLYSALVTDPPVPGVVLGHFVLGPNAGFPIVGVVGFFGQPKEIDTGPMGPAPGQPEGSHTDWVTHNFWLQFVSGQCPAVGGGCTPLPGPSTLFSKSPGDPGYIFLDFLNFAHLSNPGIVSFGAQCTDPNNCRIGGVNGAPEPGTLGLILGALGGGWLARRRKAKAAAA